MQRKTSNSPSLSRDAAIVLALAGTSLPFAQSEHAQSERWLRILRLHGQVGRALQALGVGEAPLETMAEPPSSRDPRVLAGDRAVEDVARRALALTRVRRGETVSTVDVLFAVFEVYDRSFDRALYSRGTSRNELIERLLAQAGVLN